jgi:hypothetical protein
MNPAMARITERIAYWLSQFESRWSLWNLVQGTGVVASFALPAWAVRAAEIAQEYAPFSWVLAGFAGVVIAAICYFLLAIGYRIRIRAKYDEKLLGSSGPINPLDRTFEGRRIFLNDFVLPSHPLVEGKTFIDCEIIGPADIFFEWGNNASSNRDPRLDAVLLNRRNVFTNGYIFRGCIFRGCSFQRITFFILPQGYQYYETNPLLNWISITPALPIDLPEMPLPQAASSGATDNSNKTREREDTK